MKFPEWLKPRVYGSLSYRAACPSETDEQITFFSHLRRNYPELGRIALHPRNEGQRTYYQAAKHKAEGLAVGAADIVICGSPTFVCELKRRDHRKSKWQDGQLAFLEACAAQGCFVCVALGWEAASLALIDWLNIAHKSGQP